MSQISSADLTYMQDSIEELMDTTCNILSPTLTTDGAGGMTASWGTAGTAITCRLDAKSFSETVQGESMQPGFGYMLTIPYGTTIAENYRVEVGSDTFSVTSVDAEKSWSACVRAYLERIW